jgi:hypothetical protein
VGSLVPLRGVRWEEWSGYYLSSGEGQPESRHLYDWREAKTELRFPEQNEGKEALKAYHLLPSDVKDWLLRLRVVEPNEDQLKIRRKLSITYVVHQPCREESFVTSERIWYCNDLPPGKAAILFIPLSPGRISFSIPADYSSNGRRKVSLPNGFVKRMFSSCLQNDESNWFLTRISGADDRQPFAFASLVFCPKQKQVFVAIEIIPPSDAVNDIQAVENLLKNFIHHHPCWTR